MPFRKTVRVGEKIGVQEIAAELRRAGYSDKSEQSPMGSYRLLSGGIEISPGPQSYHSPESATILSPDGQVSQHQPAATEILAPTNWSRRWSRRCLMPSERSKRQVVKYDQIPKVMVNAVLAIEDRRFFEHGGVNFVRMAEAAMD